MPSAPNATSNPLLIAAPSENLCLSYVNTLYWRGSPAPTESLNNWADLLKWSTSALAYAAPALQVVEEWSAAHAAQAARQFDLAIALREAMYRIFSALATGQPVADPDLAALNQALAEAPRRGELARTASGGYVWRAAPLTPSVPALLAPVLWSAADLLTRVAPQRVWQCANPKCLWLFVDASKGGTRRWCDMSSCGNRAKAQRHYHKKREK